MQSTGSVRVLCCTFLTVSVMVYTLTNLGLFATFASRNRLQQPAGGARNLQQTMPVFAELNHASVAPDDPKLLDAIRRHYLVPPSSKPYALPTAYGNSSDFSLGQSRVVDAIFKGKRGGFFVECGALEGMFLSNSLFLEKDRGWTGLLLEPDPLNFAHMRTKNRKAYMSQTCLTQKPYPQQAFFTPSFLTGRVITDDSDFSGTDELNQIPEHVIPVQCFPLLALLMALNTTQVDYFSLDIEGAELAVLKSIHWDKLDIKVLSVEYQHQSSDSKAEIRSFMESQQYLVATEVNAGMSANDFIFVKRDMTAAIKDINFEREKELPQWAKIAGNRIKRKFAV